MASTPEVNVSTPSGGSQEVPASVVEGPAGGASYSTTGGTTNPVTGASAPVSLPSSLADKEYPGVISQIAASEHRETLNDKDVIGRIQDLLTLLKGIQDGSVANGKFQAKMSPDMTTVLKSVASRMRGVVQGDLINLETSPLETPVAKSLISKLKAVTVNAIRTHYQEVGINPGTASSYQALMNVGGGQLDRLRQESATARGQTAPLAPLTRTTGLLNLLNDLETGRSTDNVNPTVWHGMLSRAGVPGGGQGSAYQLSQANPYVEGDLDPGSVLSPSTKRAVTAATINAIQQHLIDLGANPSDVSNARSYKALMAVTLPSHLAAMAGTDGYDLSHVTTFGSFFRELQDQSIRTPRGPGIPGGMVKTPAQPAQPGNGTQFFDAFKRQWQTNAAYRAEVSAALNTAGVTPTQIGDTQADYSAAANALITVMKQTPPGENPWQYLKAQPEISDTLLHQNQGYALVLAEATKLGANLSSWQINRLAQVYSDVTTTTGSTQALDEAIAGLYRYDPNQDTQPGSYAMTALETIQSEFGKYGINLTQDQAGAYVQALLNKGGADLTSIYSAGDAAQAYADKMAKTAATQMFPTLAPMINAGDSLVGSGGVLAPYTTAYANMLGLNPDTVTLTPELMKLMAAGPTGSSTLVGQGAGGVAEGGPGQKGMPTAQSGLKSIDQFQAAVMQDPNSGWGSSPNAYEAYSNMANTLMSTMGFAPPQGAQAVGQPATSNLAGGQV